MIPRPIAVLFGFLALFHWASMATAQAQGQADHRLVLKGYDPVAYFIDGKPTPGKPEFETVFDESRYRFSSTGNQSLFLGNPEKYAPQFAGACTNGLAKGVKLEADPTLWRIVDGKLFVFTGRSIPGEMDSDPKGLIAQASENWKTLAHQPFAEGSH